MRLIDWEQKELPISTQAKLLHLNRSSLYYQPAPPSPEEVAFKHRIDEIFTEHPYYGYRRIAAQLHREGRALDNIFTERLWRTIKYEDFLALDREKLDQKLMTVASVFN